MLSFKEFLKLSPKEKAKRYHELSEKERLLARMNDWQPGSSITVEKASKENQEKQEEFMRYLKDALKEDEINLLK